MIEIFKVYSFSLCTSQHRLKSSQREKVRQFIVFTETNEKTAIQCLSLHDWKLDVASDSYFQNPERFYTEPKSTVDKRRLTQLFERYKGEEGKMTLACQENSCIQCMFRSVIDDL